MKLDYQVIDPPPRHAKISSTPPILLLHGRMDSKKTWKRLAPEIAEKTGRKVIIYDARNHGDSPWSDEMNFDVLARDLGDFLEDHGIERAILVGHSMGGRTAITFALKKPGMVEKLFVEDMNTRNYDSVSRMSVEFYLGLLRESLSVIPPGSDEVTAKTAIIEFLTSNLPPASSEKKTGSLFDLDTLPIKLEGGEYKWQANLDVLEAMLTSERNDQTLTGVYDGPAFFLYGTESFFDVLNDENINKLFPRAQKVGVDGCGHLIHHEFPEEFLHHVIKFINSDSISSTL